LGGSIEVKKTTLQALTLYKRKKKKYGTLICIVHKSYRGLIIIIYDWSIWIQPEYFDGVFRWSISMEYFDIPRIGTCRLNIITHKDAIQRLITFLLIYI